MLGDPTRAQRGLVAATALLAALALSAPAAAQQPSAADKETARALMDTGDERMDARDFPAALEAYRAADAMMRLPMTGVAVARAQAAAGMLLDARDKALQVAQLPAQPGETPAYARARADAAALADKLAGRIPSIQVVLDHPPPDVVVAVDGAALLAAARALPRKVNPGAHVVTATAAGFGAARAEITVPEGAEILVPLALAPSAGAGPLALPLPPPQPSARHVSPLVYIGFGAGGAGFVAGAVAGVLSVQKTAIIKANCHMGACPAGQHEALASANALANISNGGLLVGVAGVVLGVVGVVRSHPRVEPPAVAIAIEIEITPMVGPGALGVQGAF